MKLILLFSGTWSIFSIARFTGLATYKPGLEWMTYIDYLGIAIFVATLIVVILRKKVS